MVFQEVYPPKLCEFAYVTDGACTENEILHQELIILKVCHPCPLAPPLPPLPPPPVSVTPRLSHPPLCHPLSVTPLYVTPRHVSVTPYLCHPPSLSPSISVTLSHPLSLSPPVSVTPSLRSDPQVGPRPDDRQLMAQHLPSTRQR